MMRNNKIARLMLLVMAAVLMMTTVAFSQDIMDIAKKGGTWFAELLSWGVGIGTLFGVAKLAAKQNWFIMIVTLCLGLGIAYLIGKPDIAMSLMGNTMQNIVG